MTGVPRSLREIGACPQFNELLAFFANGSRFAHVAHANYRRENLATHDHAILIWQALLVLDVVAFVDRYNLLQRAPFKILPAEALCPDVREPREENYDQSQ